MQNETENLGGKYVLPKLSAIFADYTEAAFDKIKSDSMSRKDALIYQFEVVRDAYSQVSIEAGLYAKLAEHSTDQSFSSWKNYYDELSIKSLEKSLVIEDALNNHWDEIAGVIGDIGESSIGKISGSVLGYSIDALQVASSLLAGNYNSAYGKKGDRFIFKRV